MKVKSESKVAQSCLTLTPWTAAYQAPLSMGFSRQEFWSGVPLPSPMIDLDSVFKSRDITLRTKVHLVKAMVFPIVEHGYESWTIKMAECQRVDAFNYGTGDTGDAGLIPGLGRSPGEGNGNPLQYYCLENPMDKGAW